MDNLYGPIKEHIDVPFDHLYLDPNNPRLGQEAPGYDDVKKISDPKVREALQARIVEMYKDLDALEASILTQGWVPVDPIIVWKHPKQSSVVVVLEGNTRVTALRRLREQYKALETQYQAKLKKKDVNKEVLEELQERLAQHEAVIKATAKLRVSPLVAKDGEELKKTLPVVLGVRHITHAQQWKPYAANLYLVRLYREEFEKRHGNAKLTLDKGVLKKVSDTVSLGDIKTRRNIQAALAFDHFKEKFEDRLPSGETFQDEDQYFFEQILQSSYAMDLFGMDKDSLHLPQEGAEALFQWAFAKVRPKRASDRNPNIFYKAENIRLLQQMKNYDDKVGTSFASYFDVSSPDTARPMEKVEADFLQSKARTSPLDTIQQLLDAYRAIPADSLISQAEHLSPMLKEIQGLTTKYVKMILAAG